ncbi:ATP-binding protein [Cobetia marina]|uniref:ATP-binding protein n=1 Tax=Cobetia marina TaxID=28258 RepID=UPI003857A1B4
MHGNIRPAARLLKTIGRDLIKDVHAAIVELVKNAYDADSSKVEVIFDYSAEDKQLSIVVQDFGHGMDYDTVVGAWLVPGTDNKVRRGKSRNKRVLQGRKGIGRFSAAALGELILLKTTSDKLTTSVTLDMSALDDIQFLDELNIPISTTKTDKQNGTRLEIISKDLVEEDVKAIWDSKQINNLFLELRSLTAPNEIYNIANSHGYSIEHDPFDIELKFINFPLADYSNRIIKIEPFNILGLYDYKVSGKVDAEGIARLEFDSQKISSNETEILDLKISLSRENGYISKYPGDIYIDLRVYDRDPTNIDNIIKRGLKDNDTGEYVGRTQARKILDEYYGIGIYREQFKIRPYGDQDVDWIGLDKKRVQNPSFRIGHNQIVGFIYIRPEEISGLEEKSARDGLVENAYYHGLKDIILRVINEMEVRRYNLRQKNNLAGRRRSLEDEINSLFDFDSTETRIANRVSSLDISKDRKSDVSTIVNQVLKDEKLKKAEYAKRIRDTIAIYQGQATLGKITHVLLHEGRKHIKYINETVPRIADRVQKLLSKSDNVDVQWLDARSKKVSSHAKALSALFKRIEPLARGGRNIINDINLYDQFENCFAIFESDIASSNIVYFIEAENRELFVKASEADIVTIFSNLIENSLYWLTCSEVDQRIIKVVIEKQENSVVIVFSDNGPGFSGNNTELMFDPGYSSKPNGTGLGLALAGEAVSRIGGKIEAKASENGALFLITFYKGI